MASTVMEYSWAETEKAQTNMQSKLVKDRFPAVRLKRMKWFIEVDSSDLTSNFVIIMCQTARLYVLYIFYIARVFNTERPCLSTFCDMPFRRTSNRFENFVASTTLKAPWQPFTTTPQAPASSLLLSSNRLHKPCVNGTTTGSPSWKCHTEASPLWRSWRNVGR